MSGSMTSIPKCVRNGPRRRRGVFLFRSFSSISLFSLFVFVFFRMLLGKLEYNMANVSSKERCGR